MSTQRIRSLLCVCLVVCAMIAFAQPKPVVSAATPNPVDERVAVLRQELKTLTRGFDRYRVLFAISEQLRLVNRIAESWRVREEIVHDETIGAGRRSLMASEVALYMALTHERARSHSFIARAKALARTVDPAELDEIDGEPAYRFLHAEAEIARRWEFGHDVALTKMRECIHLAWSNFNDPALSAKRRRAAANEMLNQVQFTALLMVQNNRPQDALGLLTETLHRIATRPELKPSASQLGFIHTGMAIALSSRDNYEAALEASNTSIEHFVRGGETASSFGLGIARRVKLMVALALGRLPEFSEDLRLLREARALNPGLQGSFPEEEVDSLQFAAAGQWKEAAARISTSIESSARWQGPENPFVKYRTAMWMLYQLNDTADPPSEAVIARFISSLAGSDSEWADALFRGSYDEDGALAESIHHLMRQAVSPTAAPTAFRANEILRIGASQGALADGAARLAAADPALRSLVEQEQLQRFERTTQRRSVASTEDLVQRRAKQEGADELVLKRQAADLERKRAALSDADAKLTALRKEIADRFPVYRELMSPQIPSAEQLGAVLRPGEAYVGLYAGLKGGQAFVVRPGGRLDAVALPVTREQTRRLVAALRKPFDAGLPPSRAGDLAGFDLGAGHALFKAWIEPLLPTLRDATTIYMAAGGTLNNLAWAALPIRPASDLAGSAWWGSEVSVVQIPSASALMLIRRQKPRPAERPYLAFADPAFDGASSEAVAGNSDRRPVRQRIVKLGVASFDYREVTRLPETLDESLAMAQSLGAGADAVIHGAAATRTRVLREDLSQARVIAFATHGLMPGDLPGLVKPSLAMAYEGRGLEDSLLSLDEVVGLRLNADWVVLSACNTGLATGDAGDSFAALVRGFFAAGARTVAATQWAVESNSAKLLMIATFMALAENQQLSKAQALSRAQRDMMAGKHGELFRHPYFWAPYVLAGDASR